MTPTLSHPTFRAEGTAVQQSGNPERQFRVRRVMTTTGRAHSLEDFKEKLSTFVPRESVERGLALQLRPSDVVISPYGKCGTTWLQQMVHSLRAGGDMDFDDISRVIPWIETSCALGLDLNAEQRAEPRAFKSHLPWDPMPRGGRYLISIREPGAALISMYRFMVGWLIEPGTVSLEEMADWYLDRPHGQDYWTHFASWWARRDDDDVLLVAYEKMKDDPRQHVKQVAEFIGIEPEESLIELALHNSSRQFMLNHADRFDDLLMRTLSETRLGLPPGSDSAKVKTVSTRLSLSESTVQRLHERWVQTIGSTFDLADYEAAVTELYR